jgi:hypothetical protein
MTDPVNTDALRDLQSLSGGILSRNLLEGSGVWKINQDVTRSLGFAADELDRLRAELAISENRAGGYEEVVAGLRTVIENAPHREHCRPNIACICWKADVL